MTKDWFNIDFCYYLEMCKKRYEERKTRWKYFDDDIEEDMEKKNRSVDHFCFSS